VPMPNSPFALYPFNLDGIRGSRSPIRSAHPAEVRAAGSGVVDVVLQRAARGLIAGVPLVKVVAEWLGACGVA
jgi:hypothetical protein